MKFPSIRITLAALAVGVGFATAQPLSENDKQISAHAQHMLTEGRRIFRFDTMGSESFWGDALQLHRAIAGEKNGGVGGGVSPKTALSVGLKVDADALPAELVAQIKAGKVDLEDPATTLALLKLNAVVGVTGLFDSAGRMRSMGVQCALCHSTVDDSFAPGIGRRLDGWANRDLNVGAIVSLAPNLKPFTELLKVDEATVKKVLASWGPGRYDALLDKDGKAFRPDGKQAGTLIPPAFGLAGVSLNTWTGFGSVPYWNAYVGTTQMHGAGTFIDRRLSDSKQYPVAAKSRSAETRTAPDLVTLEAPGAALLPELDPGAEAARRQLRCGRREARRGAVQRQGEVLELPCAAALYRAGPRAAFAEGNGHRFVPGRPLADAHVPHRAARGTVDAPEGRLLPRRPLRHAGPGARALRPAFQATAHRPGKGRPGWST